MNQPSIDEYIISLGRIRHERLYARPRWGTLYVLTDLPPSVLGYARLEPERCRYSIQRTLDEYLCATPDRDEKESWYRQG